MSATPGSPNYPGSWTDIPGDGSWTHEGVADEINAIATALGINPQGSHAALADRLAAIETLPWDTVDTVQPFRLILFSNGTVKAIPKDTPNPTAPTGLSAEAHVSHVTVTWTAAATPAAKYVVFRDGTQIGTSTTTSYRDNNVTVSATYSYTVRTEDAYGQQSPLSSAVSAFIDPALNVAPTVTVTSWPPAYFTDGKTLLRVCGSDVDAQTLAFALSVDAGSLQATDDPSIWYYLPPIA